MLTGKPASESEIARIHFRVSFSYRLRTAQRMARKKKSTLVPRLWKTTGPPAWRTCEVPPAGSGTAGSPPSRRARPRAPCAARAPRRTPRTWRASGPGSRSLRISHGVKPSHANRRLWSDVAHSAVEGKVLRSRKLSQKFWLHCSRRAALSADHGAAWRGARAGAGGVLARCGRVLGAPPGARAGCGHGEREGACSYYSI